MGRVLTPTENRQMCPYVHAIPLCNDANEEDVRGRAHPSLSVVPSFKILPKSACASAHLVFIFPPPIRSNVSSHLTFALHSHSPRFSFSPFSFHRLCPTNACACGKRTERQEGPCACARFTRRRRVFWPRKVLRKRCEVWQSTARNCILLFSPLAPFACLSFLPHFPGTLGPLLKTKNVVVRGQTNVNLCNN